MRFELLHELGHGGMGVVYKARDTETGAVVALKRLKAGAAFAADEVLLAKTISHPNVCQVYELLEEEDHTSISMEFVDGESLQEYLKRRGPLSIDETLYVAGEVLNGLEAAHQAGIVHRDLNPQNILIASNGRVKLTDFGLAGKAGQPETRFNLAGTPGFIAPEQIMGLVTDERTDIYALGFILYQLLYNVRDVPGWLAEAVSCSTQKDPGRRYSSAAEMRTALRGPRAGRRKPARLAILAVVLLMVIGAPLIWLRFDAALPTVQPPPVLPPPAVPPPALSREKPTLAVLFEGPIGDLLGTAILRRGEFTIVERIALEKAVAELKLKDKFAVDPATGQRVGKVVGARYFLWGSSHRHEGLLFINAKIVETETTLVLHAAGTQGDPKDAVKLVEDLAARLHP
jgi:serine/threonine protein kinase